MKKILLSLLLSAVMLGAFPAAACAADNTMSFDFVLSVDGARSAEVEPGDEVGVTVVLNRTDARESFPMYAVQYNLWYDSGFFELVPDSISFGSDSRTGLTLSQWELSGSWEGWSGISAGAYSSALEGDEWPGTVTLLSFRLKALKTGTSSLLSRSCSVSTEDGQDVYLSEANDARVVVSTESSGTGGETEDPSEGGNAGGGGGGSLQQPDDTQPDQENPDDSGASLPPSEDDGETDSRMPSALFDDIPAGAWYEDAVSYVLRANLFNGTGDAVFSPDNPMTRAMLVTVLHRLEGTPSAADTGAFSDVPGGQWYTEAVAWADDSGIVTGYGNGLFGTDDSITRQQLAAVLYRYANLKGYDTSASADLSGYRDEGSVADWAEPAVRWAVASGIITGTDSSTLAPSGTASRAQVAAMLMRFADLYD